MVAPLLALSLFLGLYPKPVLDRIEPTVKRAVHNLERKTDYREPKPPASWIRRGPQRGADDGEGGK